MLREIIETRNFYKENGNWFIHLPEYLQSGGIKDDLQMIKGADTWLDNLSGSANEITIKFSNCKFDGCQDSMIQSLIAYGGAAIIDTASHELDTGMWYTTKSGHDLWLCPVTKFIFGGVYPIVIFYSAT
jgi:hypothetical protein